MSHRPGGFFPLPLDVTGRKNHQDPVEVKKYGCFHDVFSAEVDRLKSRGAFLSWWCSTWCKPEN